MRILLGFFLLFSMLNASAQLTYETLNVNFDSSWQYKNLKIIPIRQKGGGRPPGQGTGYGDVVSLNQAIRQGLVTVSERGTTAIENVHWLRIDNNSSKSVYVSSGEIVEGGRQDRMIARDTILEPTHRDQYVPTMCVEEGRWSEKEKKFGYAGFANPHLRKVLDSTHSQVMVWREVEQELDQGKFKNKTLSYLARNEDKKYVQVNDEYFNFFLSKFRSTDSSIVGFVAVSGNKVIGSDIFADPHLFYSQVEPLLRGYIDDAVILGGPVTLTIPPIRKYCDKLLSSEASQEDFVKKNGKIFRQNGHIIHINTFLKDQ